jgi:hypothetical protein
MTLDDSVQGIKVLDLKFVPINFFFFLFWENKARAFALGEHEKHTVGTNTLAYFTKATTKKKKVFLRSTPCR